MKYLVAIALILLLLAVNSVLLRTARQPTPQMTIAQMEIKEAAQWNGHVRWQALTWTGTVAISLALLGGGYYMVALAKNKRERVYADPDTGLWPIIREDRAPFWKRLMGEHDWIVEDPNLAIAPSRRIYANGSLHIQADTHGVPLEQQMQYAMQSWPVQRTVASANGVNRPTVAAMKAAAGVYDAEARRKTAQATIAEQRIPASHQIEVVPTEQQPVLTAEQALQRSANGVVCIGQEGTLSHNLAVWDTSAASTLGIFGANGTGKTTTVATMVTLAMLRWGWQLYILDGKDAGDWDEFGNHAEVLQVDRYNIESAMESIWQEYQRRKAMMSQYRARNYQHLPAEVQAQNPRWGIVFEEYGATRLRLRNALRAQLDKFVDILCKEARYTGWHGVFIDQRPSDYTDDMKGNLKTIACFKLLMNQGHAVNAYHAGKLANRGEFEMDGARYWAFYAEGFCRNELAKIPVRKAFVNRSLPVRTNEPTNADERSANDYERQPQETNAPNVHERTGDVDEQTLSAVYERTRSWDEVGKKFFELQPAGTQADLRRAMAAIDGRDPDAFKGEAHRLYHAYRQQPATVAEQIKAMGFDLGDVRVRGGDKLGIDTTHEGDT